jgi:hypothetical protein
MSKHRDLAVLVALLPYGLRAFAFEERRGLIISHQ